VGLPDGERFLGLIHLGSPRGEPPAPERASLNEYRLYLP
jgi:nitroreductase